MRSTPRLPAHPAPDQAGFTLIELLVALVISGLLVGVIFQLMEGQARYVGVQSSREEVQQNARAALELIGSELRSVPPGAGLVAAASDSVTVRVPRAWGVVCAVSGSQVVLRIPAIAGLDYTPNDSTAFAGRAGAGGAPWTEPVSVTAVGNGSDAACAPAAGTERRRLTLQAPPATTTGTPLQAGNVAYLYDQVSYTLGQGADGKHWIRRRSGSGGNQPLAGPVEFGTEATEKGLRFRYFNGATELSPPLGAAALASVTRVEVVVRAVSRGPAGPQRQTQHDSVTIALRNRS